VEPQDPYSEFQLAEQYDQDDSVPGNEHKAIFWFTKAGAQGVEEAQVELGDHYLTGHGVRKNRIKAIV